MNKGYALVLIIVMAAVTFAIRLSPFVLFGSGKEPPRWVKRLGVLLPPALMSVLVIYCIRNVDFIGSASHGLPEIISIAVTMGLHAWKRNVMLSIVSGTVLYMVLIRIV